MNIKNIEFVDFSFLGYGHRVGIFAQDTPSSLPVNSRKITGKIGIKAHNSLSRFFFKTILIKGTDQKTKKETNIYLNRSSVIKWINPQLNKQEQLGSQCSNAVIISKIQQLILNPKDPASDQTNNSNSSINRSKIHSLRTRFHYVFCKALFFLTGSSWGLFKLRMKFLTLSEKRMKAYSESLACSAFIQSKKNVRAYKDFVGSKFVKYFNDLPITSKESYIKKYSLDETFGERSLYIKGNIPKGSKKDTSTGTSGKPTSWYRGPKEIEVIHRTINFSAKAVLGERPYYLINGFALGPWATGITIATAAAKDPNATVCNIGMDTKEIFQAIKDATQVVPKGEPIIVAGYPPHLKEVVDLAVKGGFNLHEHNIIGIVGGESMSENQRSLINKNEGKNFRTGFQQCYSAYGASDLDVAIGYETDFAIELRQKLHQNSELTKELLGKSDFVPMVFPYDPFNYHIETDENQNLIYTCVRGDRISPRVRYDLGDKGKVVDYSEVMAILKKHGIEMKSKVNVPLPFVFVWGRVGTHVSYFGLKIAPENLDDAIKSQNLSTKILHFGFLQFEKIGNKGLEILIETEEGNENKDELQKKILAGLQQYNQEFNKLMSEGQQPPNVKIYKKGTSPMSIHRQQYPHQKKQYIFNEGDQFCEASKKKLTT